MDDAKADEVRTWLLKALHDHGLARRSCPWRKGVLTSPGQRRKAWLHLQRHSLLSVGDNLVYSLN